MNKKSIFNKIGILASIGALIMSAMIAITGGSYVFLFASFAILCANLTVYIAKKKKDNNNPK